MWFGVAPAPAPSPRTNTKAWHPPHCTCAKHKGLPKLSVGSPKSSNSSSPHHRPQLLTPLKASHQFSPQAASPRHRPTAGINEVTIQPTRPLVRQGKVKELAASSATHISLVENRASLGTASPPAPVILERRRRPSRRMKKSDQAHTADGLSKKGDEPEVDASRSATDRDNNDANPEDSSGRTLQESVRTDSRRGGQRGTGSATPFSAPSKAFSLDIPGSDDRLHPSTSTKEEDTEPVLPSRSRRGSRARSRRESAGTHLTNKGIHGGLPLAVAAPDKLYLNPPMTERAQPANLVGHTSSVSTVILDKECYIVSASIDGSVKIWSRTTFDCLKTLYGHHDTVSCVDFSSEWLVSGSHDMTLRVYDAANDFNFVGTLHGHQGHVTKVELLPIGSSHEPLALSCSDDSTLRLWNLVGGYTVAEFKAHTSRVTCFLVFSHNPTRFCSGSADAMVCFWDFGEMAAAGGQDPEHTELSCCVPIKSHRVHKTTVQRLLSASGRGEEGELSDTVFSCSNDGTIQWFSARTAEYIGCIDSVESPIYSMAIHTSLNYLVCSTGDGRLLMYSDLTARGTVTKKELVVAPTWISSLQLLYGHLLACGSEENLYIVNLSRARIDRVITTAHGFINCVRWLQPEKLVTSGEDNVIKIWSIL